MAATGPWRISDLEFPATQVAHEKSAMSCWLFFAEKLPICRKNNHRWNSVSLLVANLVQILDIRSKEGILSWVYLIPFVFKDWLNIQGEIELFNMAGDAASKGQAERFIARR